MSKIEVNTVDVQCGSTLTLGSAGKTVQIACGATTVGMGRTGAVNWQTSSIKTATFTAVSGEGYFCNTAGGAFEVDLPAGSAGAIVSVQDYNNTFDTNALTIDPNGTEKINGGDPGASLSLVTEGKGVTFVYIDATVGWRSVQDNEFSTGGSNYIVATGGTITTCGDYKIHTFTSDAPFNVSSSGSPTNGVAEYLVVAGGGSGGSENGQSVAGGGGGAGGFRFASPSIAPLTYPAKPLAGPSTLTLSATNYPISVGGGGAKAPTGTTAGSVSTFSSITSAGGGGGAFTGAPGPSGLRAGNPGGSGGGASHATSNSGPSGGAGNTPPVSPPQGNNGGGMASGTIYLGAGGGGAMAVGAQAPNSSSGAGGIGGGLPTAFGSNGVPSGSYRYYSGGGGGGGASNTPQTGSASAGGTGGGATGGAGQNPAPADATANTGGGGGGSGNQIPNPGTPLTGSNGGSGIVVIRYKYQN